MAGRTSSLGWLAASGMALLLALLLGATAALAAEPHRKDDPLLARVNGHPLHLSDVYASIETLSLGDQIDARDQLDTYIEAMINEEVIFQWALQTDFDGDAELRREVKELVVRHLIDTHVHSRVHVTEADALAFYNQHPSLVRGEHVRARQILLSKRPRCQQLRTQIHSNDQFIAAAKKYSLDARTRANGGDLGLILRDQVPAGSYEAALFKMKPGEMRIFDVPQGCVLVRLVSYVDPPLPAFSMVRERLLRYLRNRQEDRLMDRLFQVATKDSKVERFYTGKGDLTHRSDADDALHRGGPATTRVAPASRASAPAPSVPRRRQ